MAKKGETKYTYIKNKDNVLEFRRRGQNGGVTNNVVRGAITLMELVRVRDDTLHFCYVKNYLRFSLN